MSHPPRPRRSQDEERARRQLTRHPPAPAYLSTCSTHGSKETRVRNPVQQVRLGRTEPTRDQRITNTATRGNARCCLSYLVSEQIWSPKPSGDDVVVPADSRSLTVNKQ